jgi:N-acetylmuramoyl-L-alanine amidase
MSQFPDFAPASVMPSSNFGVRAGGQPADCLLLHYTGMSDGASALALLCDPASQVSCHYLVFEEGRIVQMIAERWRAWHAGLSFWKGETDLNSLSIGIEIVHPGHDPTGTKMAPYPPQQIAAVIELCRDIVTRNNIASDRILAHSDVAPDRKIDPGERFPWNDLYRAGIGHWVEPIPPDRADMGSLAPPVETIRHLQEMLIAYGYGLTISGHYDHATKLVVAAFQRHFRQARVDGVADRSTLLTLQKLLQNAPRPEAPESLYFSDYDATSID